MPGSSTSQEPIRARVTNLCGKLPSRYAVTRRVDTGQTVTFALVDSVWSQPSEPVKGEEVELREVYKTARGFRANIARRITA